MPLQNTCECSLGFECTVWRLLVRDWNSISFRPTGQLMPVFNRSLGNPNTHSLFYNNGRWVNMVRNSSGDCTLEHVIDNNTCLCDAYSANCLFFLKRKSRTHGPELGQSSMERTNLSYAASVIRVSSSAGSLIVIFISQPALNKLHVIIESFARWRYSCPFKHYTSIVYLILSLLENVCLKIVWFPHKPYITRTLLFVCTVSIGKNKTKNV